MGFIFSKGVCFHSFANIFTKLPNENKIIIGHKGDFKLVMTFF